MAAGMDYTALHVADNRWADAKLSGVSGNAAKVIFKGSTEVAELELDLVRLKPAAARAARPSGSGRPRPRRRRRRRVRAESLEILPDDSEDVIAQASNMFKRQGHKDREEKQGGCRAARNGRSRRRTRPSKKADKRDPHWDPTRNHSELAARLAMEKSLPKATISDYESLSFRNSRSVERLAPRATRRRRRRPSHLPSGAWVGATDGASDGGGPRPARAPG